MRFLGSRKAVARRADRWLWLGVIVAVVGWAVLLARPGSAGGTAGPDRVEWRTELEKAKQEAADTGRPLLINFTADWCPPCKEMKAKVYSDEGFAAWLGETFVPVKVDLTQPGESEQKLAERYQAMYIPTLIVAQADGQAIASTSGFVPKDDLRAALQRVVEEREPAEATEEREEPKGEAVERAAQET